MAIEMGETYTRKYWEEDMEDNGTIIVLTVRSIRVLGIRRYRYIRRKWNYDP